MKENTLQLYLCAFFALALGMQISTDAFARNQTHMEQCIADVLDGRVHRGTIIPDRGASRDLTIYIDREIPGKRGGKRYVIRRRSGEPWASNYLVGPNAPTGSPLFLEQATNSKIAKFFGYEQVSRYAAHVPDADELNGAISVINPHLKGTKKISVKYYPVKGQISEEEYLRRFAKEGALPIGSDGRMALHDINLHAGAMLFPKEGIDLARRQAQATLDFIDYLRKQPRSPRIDAFIEQALGTATRKIDAGTGNLLIGVGSKDDGRTIFRYWSYLTHSQRSPADALKELIESTPSNLVGFQAKEMLTELLKRFERNRPKPSGYDRGLNWNPSHVLERFRDQIRQIDQAVDRANAA